MIRELSLRASGHTGVAIRSPKCYILNRMLIAPDTFREQIPTVASLPRNDIHFFDTLQKQHRNPVLFFYQYLPKVQLGQWQALHIWHRPPSARLVSSSFVILSPAKIWGRSTSNTVVGSLMAAPGTPRMGTSPR